MTTMKNPGIFGNEKHNKMAAVKHRISVIGLLKDVEFHMIKGAAEVYLGISVKYVPGKYGLRLSSYLLFLFLTSESFWKRSRLFLYWAIRSQLAWVWLGCLYTREKEGRTIVKNSDFLNVNLYFISKIFPWKIRLAPLPWALLSIYSDFLGSTFIDRALDCSQLNLPLSANEFNGHVWSWRNFF